jgi:membrane-associated phospholipid phosphatase
MDIAYQWQINLIAALQTVGVLELPMKAFTFLGSEEFFLLLLPLAYWCIDMSFGARLAVMLIGANGLSGLLKLALHGPRPYWISQRVRPLVFEYSYGLPSNHALVATTVWGFMAVHIRRTGWWIVLIAVILLISLSRLFLAMHFVTDVLLGWALGALLLALYSRYEKPAVAWLRRQGLGAQVALALGISLAYLALALGTHAALAGVVDPESWGAARVTAALALGADPASDPRNLEDPITVAAMFFAVGAGLALAVRYVRFDARGPWLKRALRYAAGFVGVLVLWRGLKLLTGEDSQPVEIALALRYVRYLLMILWVVVGAPWVFLKTRLADAA